MPEEPSPDEPVPDDPTPGETPESAPLPSDPPPLKSFMPRVLPGSAPAEGEDVGGNVPTGGIVGWLVGAALPKGDDPTPTLEGPEGVAPVCPMRGAACDDEAPAPNEGGAAPAGDALAPEGDAAGRAAAGVPPLKSEEGGELAVDPAPVRAAAAEDEPVEPAVPAGGAAATRGEPNPGVEEVEADGLAAGGFEAARELAPKLGGPEGVAPEEPEPAGGIVGRVDPEAGSKSDPPPNEDDGGGLFDGWNEPPEPT